MIRLFLPSERQMATDFALFSKVSRRAVGRRRIRHQRCRRRARSGQEAHGESCRVCQPLATNPREIVRPLHRDGKAADRILHQKGGRT
jgi:hypothetical protein